MPAVHCKGSVVLEGPPKRVAAHTKNALTWGSVVPVLCRWLGMKHVPVACGGLVWQYALRPWRTDCPATHRPGLSRLGCPRTLTGSLCPARVKSTDDTARLSVGPGRVEGERAQQARQGAAPWACQPPRAVLSSELLSGYRVWAHTGCFGCDCRGGGPAVSLWLATEPVHLTLGMAPAGNTFQASCLQGQASDTLSGVCGCVLGPAHIAIHSDAMTQHADTSVSPDIPGRL